MGSDFSALDAELATLETGPAVEVLSLAHAYAGTSLELLSVDAVLNELDADGPLLRTRSSFPPERSPERKQRRSEAPQASEEIVLPDPVPRELQRSEPGSGEMPLHVAHENGQRARSGSYQLEQQAKPSFKAAGHSGRDDTLEPFDEELIDADEDMIEFTAAAPSENDRKSESVRPARRDSLFAKASEVSAQEEADAAFEELFSEAATRNSSIPSTRNSQAPETYNDDTETFDTSALGFIENDTSNNADASMDEELDSAEFEIVVDGEGSKNGSIPRNPSDGPEKRPSFLGRLFGRKDD